jgi:predicted nucleic acid-binding protein
VTYLLDTNVVSEVRRKRPEPAVVAWFESVDDAQLYLSVLVVGEIREGVERLRSRDPAQSASLEQWLASLLDGFGDRVLDVTSTIAEAWGRLRVGASLPVIDSILAATALVHGLTVVTRDRRPFEQAGVPYVDPWQPR